MGNLELIERDVIDGYVSVKGAKENYYVVINPKTTKVDMVETQKLPETLK